jgi:NTE family protein
MVITQVTRAILVTLLLSLFASGQAYAAEDDRPRIGLVLGGGGARGIAHIGVLKELERLQVPIDAIAGTSMGAIVGGLYASGLTAEELEEVVLSLNWSEALSDTPRRRNLSFRRKQDDVRYPIDLELGVRGRKILLPKGLVQGQNLDPLLRGLTAHVSHISDFSALPIPFRAVATDIETGSRYVMTSGDLARSIRASMSVPGLIAPTSLDGRLLVDGGVVANLPIDIARSMDVDIIIAVDVEFPLYALDEMQSAPAITEQMFTILIHKETQRQIAGLESKDVLIRPALGIFSSSDFANARLAVEKGSDAIGAVESRLAELSIEEDEYAWHVASRAAASRPQDKLEFVRFEHDGRLATELLAARAGVHAGDTIDHEDLASGASRLYGLDMFEQVDYQIIEEDDQVGVVYTAVSKSWGPDFLNVGATLQDDLDGTTVFNLEARLTRTGMNHHGGEWRTDLMLGTDFLLESEFYQPFGQNLKYFVAPRFNVEQRNRNVFADGQDIAQLRVAEAEFGIDLGAELGQFGELRFGVYRGDGKLRVKIGDPAVSDIRYDLGAVFAQVEIDTFDQSRFPTSGSQAILRWDGFRKSLGASDSFEKLGFDLLSAWSRGKNILNAGVSIATTFETNDQIQEFTPMGGFLRLSGLDFGQINGPHAAIGKLVYYRLLGDNAGGLLDVPMYLGGSVELGNVWQDRSDISFDSMLVNGSVFAAFDTYFGAFYVAVGLAEGGEHAFYLSIGSTPLYQR